MNLNKWFSYTSKLEQGTPILNATAKDETPELMIYDVIVQDDFWGGITSKGINKELEGLKDSKEIKVRINSPGGSVFEGLAIYNSLVNHPAKIIVQIDSLAASIASIIALAGDEITMAENGFFMIHNPWSLAMGDASDMRKTADTLDQLKTSLITTYSARSGYTEEEISKLMDEETWLSGEQALEAGFVDSLIPVKEKAPKALLEPDLFKNCPESLIKTDEKEPEKQFKSLDFYKKRLQLAEIS